MKIPISAAKNIAEKYGQMEVMIVGWNDKNQVCLTTYGIDKTHCKYVAMLADKFADFLGVVMEKK